MKSDQTYVRIKNENEALLVKDLYNELLTTEGCEFPIFVGENSEDWFDASDINDEQSGSDGYNDVIRECRRYASDSISVSDYVKRRLEEEK